MASLVRGVFGSVFWSAGMSVILMYGSRLE